MPSIFVIRFLSLPLSELLGVFVMWILKKRIPVPWVIYGGVHSERMHIFEGYYSLPGGKNFFVF